MKCSRQTHRVSGPCRGTLLDTASRALISSTCAIISPTQDGTSALQLLNCHHTWWSRPHANIKRPCISSQELSRKGLYAQGTGFVLCAVSTAAASTRGVGAWQARECPAKLA